MKHNPSPLSRQRQCAVAGCCRTTRSPIHVHCAGHMRQDDPGRGNLQPQQKRLQDIARNLDEESDWLESVIEEIEAPTPRAEED